MNGIGKYIQEQIQNHFTGFIKVAYEKGKPKSLSVYNNLENKYPNIDSNFDLAAELKKAEKPDFWGTLGFTIVDGEIKSYSFTQIRQGLELDKFLMR